MSNFSSVMREIISTIVTFVVVFVLVWLLRLYVVEPFQVDGRSMDNTLQDGERLVMLKLADIERFDVVVVPPPNAPEKLYVKRVIGMPGDTIEFRDDMLILNGQPLEEPYLAEMQAQVEGNFTYDMTLEERTGVTQVPEGQIFVMGDNRRNSTDGRSFGFINLEDVRGEADFIHWPLSEFGLLTKYELNADGTAIVER
ncbi:signal peptidase I [Fundicoccus culcitae]|uniref:Signal peptidase I n=1 Tax=Fundicoccus culcitae TaxID=2969821 RepID=A0ABY5P4I4_9LACT|nr:signal peptidase I [Fundicoccus culcitae]UUX33621.1 signal peptidase I [Fundicoccus culcitae]